jgi:prolipoprotein diacylglyceryltransferase
MAGVVLVVGLVTGFRNKWKKPGSSFLFSISLFLLVRFAVEFFKDQLAHTTGGVMIGFLNQTQWGIVFILPVLCCLGRKFRHPSLPDPEIEQFSIPPFRKKVLNLC